MKQQGKPLGRDAAKARLKATQRLRAACDQFAAAMGDAASVLGREDAHTFAVTFLGRDLGEDRGLGIGPRVGERKAKLLFEVKRVTEEEQ